MATAHVRDVVEFVDPQRQSHTALVTHVWGDADDSPTINLVWVSVDDSKHDQYGTQIERNTSVQHESRTTAPGMFWRNV